MSNLLSLPLVAIDVLVSNNEDWIDAIKYVEGTDASDPNAPQVDLSGITFQMEIRRTSDDHEVVIAASSADGGLSIGTPPNLGFLIIHVTDEVMSLQQANTYVGDIVGDDGSYRRTIVEMTLTINEGITKWQS